MSTAFLLFLWPNPKGLRDTKAPSLKKQEERKFSNLCSTRVTPEQILLFGYLHVYCYHTHFVDLYYQTFPYPPRNIEIYIYNVLYIFVIAHLNIKTKYSGMGLGNI